MVLVSRDTMLAGALRSLLEAPGGVRVLDWYSEDLDAAIRHADVVIVDMPPNLHERTFAVIDGRFLGRTVVLLEEGEHAEALPPGPPRAVLYRPVQIGELWTAVTGATPPAPAEPEPPSPEETTGSVGAEVAPAVGSEVEVEAQGLPVTGSGRLIGLSGQELDPVIAPGQVAPGMDQATLERLRGWGSRGGQPTAGGTGPAPGTRHGTAGREEAGQAKAAQEEARQAARTEAGRARAEEQRTARAEARQAKAAEAKVRREQAQQAKAALGRPGVRGLLPIALIGVAVAGVGLGLPGGGGWGARHVGG